MSAKPGAAQRSHKPVQHRQNLDWQQHAACRDTRPEIFHAPNRAAEALSVCRPCPVQDPCWELGKGSTGVWGGKAKYPRKAGRPRA